MASLVKAAVACLQVWKTPTPRPVALRLPFLFHIGCFLHEGDMKGSSFPHEMPWEVFLSIDQPFSAISPCMYSVCSEALSGIEQL